MSNIRAKALSYECENIMEIKTLSRIVIAGTSSGVGKTTLALAIMAALTRRGLGVQGFKVGPDFIDPGYYEMVTGRPGRNLDIWMTGRDTARSLFENAALRAGISIVEGVMGFYDGKNGLVEGSTADVAKTVRAPVLLTIDCAKTGGSAGAMALGYRAYDEAAGIQGFLLNNVGSDRHEKMVKSSVEAATGLPVVGVVRRDAAVVVPERHLGLVTRVELGPAGDYVDALVELAESYIDLKLLLEIAASTPYPVTSAKSNPPAKTAGNARADVKIGVAFDKAFSFYYRDNFDMLREAGAELVFFSPLEDERLPEDIEGLYLGGGYPEVHAAALAANLSMAADIKRAVEDGMAVYAECGGLIYLSEAVVDFAGNRYRMSGALPIACKMKSRATLGYRVAVAAADSIIAEQGSLLRGHEFHYSEITESANDLERAYEVGVTEHEGFIYNNTLASYIHLHFAGYPRVVERFLASCRANSSRMGSI
ncbi:MAG: cobyrinate a,c-diamide synthase [Actinobacteria bacterium]|nr:cobyrinate a,c-diamide synthase [Actinomycetota bacterium]